MMTSVIQGNDKNSVRQSLMIFGRDGIAYTLIIQQKWHTTKRNLREGDIVLLQESSMIRGKWRLAEVCEAAAGKDGNVRDVKVRYKPQNDSKEYTGCKDIVVNRSAHRLVIILPLEEKENQDE